MRTGKATLIKAMWKTLLMSAFLLVAATSLHAVEICDNGIDDDGDGYVDCYDPDCSGFVGCSGSYINVPAPNCQFTPTPSAFQMAEKWRTNAAVAPMDNRQTPIVADLNADGIPEVVGRQINVSNALYVFGGANGALQQAIASPPSDVFLDAVATGDIDNDGFGEIITIAEGAASTRLMYCYEHTGALKWASNVPVGYNVNDDRWVPGIADFDQDGNAEIYAGNQIFNGQTGVLIASGGAGGSFGSSPLSINEAISIAGDVLPDAFCADCAGMELVCGNRVYAVNLVTGVMTSASVGTGVSDGPTSLADIDLDGDLDAVVTGSAGGNGTIYVWDLQTSAQVATPFQIGTATAAAVNTTAGGHANVADFNGDGTPEIGLAGRSVYVVVDYNAVTGTLVELWSRLTQDNSERTGSSVFDFEGDGSNEVVYRDETTLFVFDGATGATKVATPCQAATRYDLPIVTDVDADGQTDIVCACSNYIVAFESVNQPWVKAREIWNQHSYHVVNVNDDLGIPQVQQAHNLGYPPSSPTNYPFNGFLTQTVLLDSTGLPIYAAPDDTVYVANPAAHIDYNLCQNGVQDSIGVRVTVANIGDEVIPLGTPIAYYDGNPFTAGATLIRSSTILVNIQPGNSALMPWTNVPDQGGAFDLWILVNDDGSIPPPILQPTWTHGECNFSNNSLTIPIQDCGNFPPQTTANGLATDTVFFTIPENQANTLCLTGTDPNGDDFDVTGLVGPPPALGTVSGFNDADTCITYTTAFNQNGVTTFSVVVCDNANVPLCDTVVVVATVFLVNEVPIAVDDIVSTPEDTPLLVAVQNNDTDPDGDSLVTTVISPPSNGTFVVNPDGSITYTPNANFNGMDTLTYVICDLGVAPQYCDTAQVYITINPVNDLPIAVNDTGSMPNDTANVPIYVVFNDIDIEGDASLTAIVCGPATGSATIVNDTVIYTPSPSFIGVDSFCYTYCDAQGCDTGIVYINVGTSNEYPVAVNDTASTTHNDQVVILVQANDSDPNGDPLVTSAFVCGPSNGTAQINPDGSIYYTPDPGFLGMDTICYVLCDSPLAGPPYCDTAQIFITVVSDNLGPIAQLDSSSTTHADSVVIAVLTNDIDPDGTLPLTVTNIPCPPSNGTATITANNEITYTPVQGFLGVDSFCYEVCDSGVPPLCDIAWVYVDVSSDNLPPTAVNDRRVLVQDTDDAWDVTTNDSDPENTPLTVSILISPLNGSVLLNGNVVTYSPVRGYIGLDSLLYEICDNGVPRLCDSAWVYYEIIGAGVNAPIGFSPNGDGDNDTWVVDGLTSYPGNSLVIFNRWGSQVFEAVDYQGDWDGTWQGEPLPEGTYYWIIDPGDGTDLVKGFVMIFR